MGWWKLITFQKELSKSGVTGQECDFIPPAVLQLKNTPTSQNTWPIQQSCVKIYTYIYSALELHDSLD